MTPASRPALAPSRPVGLNWKLVIEFGLAVALGGYTLQWLNYLTLRVLS
jgi:hypothetical protein